MKKRLTIYVLECNDNKYYVGKSLNLNRRLKEHFNGIGSGWTRKYPPIQIDKIINKCNVYDEDKYTLMYMNKYGIENVRGGSYCRIVLPDYQLRSLTDQLNHIRNLCFYCGDVDHFISNCSQKY